MVTGRGDGRPPSKGRRPTQKRLIEDKKSRQTTFSKRRPVVLDTASDLSLLTGVTFAVVVFSETGRVYAFGTPSVDAVLRRYYAAPLAPPPPPHPHVLFHGDDPEALRVAAKETKAEVAAEKARSSEAAERIITRGIMAGRVHWWDADAEALGLAEVTEFVRALKRLRDSVRRRADVLLSGGGQPKQKQRRRRAQPKQK